MTPLMLFALAWMGGILLARAANIPSVWLLLALPPALVLLIGWGDRRGMRRAAAMLLGLMLGGLRLTAALPQITADHVAYYRDHGTVEVEGVVIAEPDRRASDARLRVRVDQLATGDGITRAVEGRLLVYVPLYPAISYGDRIRATGPMETPPAFEDFSYKDYLAREGIYAMLRDADVTVLALHQANPVIDGLLRFKELAHQHLQALLPEPQGSLLAGILLGTDQGIPDELNKAFEITGTSHIVAISGFNLTMIAGLVTRMTRRFLQRRGGLLVAFLAIWIYVALVGANASVARAGVMSSLLALGQQEGRRTHGPTSLAAAVLVLSAINPYVLWDSGFQLSAAATLGMMLYVPPLAGWLTALLTRWMDQERAKGVVSGLSDILIVTLAVQVTTLGITIWSFRSIPLVAPLTNLLILPAQPFIMVFGGLALAAAFVIWPLGRFFAWIAWVFLTYTIEVVRLTAALPLANIPVPEIDPAFVWGYYLLLGVFTLWLVTRGSYPLGERLRAVWDWVGDVLGHMNPYVRAGAGAVIVLGALYFGVRPDDKLHVVFFDTGEGDAVFIRTPGGRQVLIDGGADSRQTLAEVGRQMPFWDHSLDLAVLTSPDDDRLSGLIPALERYDVAYVGYGPEAREDGAFEQWQSLIDRRLAGTSGELRQGDVWDLEDDVRLEVLWPPSDREGPLVLRVSHGEVRMLLMGDATTVVEGVLVEAYGADLRSQVLLLPRQGVRTCCSAALLQAVAPEVATVQGDRLDDVVRAKLMDTPLYETSRQGTVEVISDGGTIRVRTRR